MNRDIKLFNSRFRQIVVICVLLMTILIVRLFLVTTIENERWTNEASKQNTKVVYTSAPRGNIYDRNGTLLAGNKQIFTVTFSASNLTTKQINDSSLALINTLRANNEKYTDNFPIKITKKGKFYYTYKVKIKKWLKKQGFKTNLTADQAFKRLRSKYHIDEKLNRFEAMEVLQDKYNLDPPISVRKMVYTYDLQLEQFLGKFAFPQETIDEGVTAEECFKTLRENYSIDKDLSDKEARRIFVVRNEIATNGFTRYIPITIAKGLKDKTITYLEEVSYPGVDIASESQRYYPNHNNASHIIGYMGAISESETSYYIDKLGYASTDLVGKDGIEAAMEEKLHGKAGMKTIQVNSSGENVAVLNETEAKKGSDVYLTIDLDLQKDTEDALRDAISRSTHSRSGAAVAIDVETGDVLAMASYPDYDPNIFANGISEKAWESVQAENPRDAFSPTPLYNNATSASVQPGSTFKPVTALAALGAGLNPQMTIYDALKINYGDKVYACSNYNDGAGSHGYENLEWGIGNSCNYFFYCIATGKDWGNGASLGYKKDITVDSILATAKKLGLGQKTGIEIYEAVADLPSAEQKMATSELGVRDYLYTNASRFFPKSVVEDYDRLKENLYTIAGWCKDNPDYDELITLIDENTDVKKSEVETVAARVKFDFFISAEWGIGDQFNIAIGQGDNAYTPLQMANYVATIGNGGKKNQVSIVYGVEGEGLTVKKKAESIGISQDNINEVIKGMERVCSSGTLQGVYGSYDVQVAGKTGTAENQAIRQPKSEVNYVKEHLAGLNSQAGSSVSWKKVKKTMNKMMEDEPERYPSKDDTVDDAAIKASGYKITQGMIDANKGSYDYFAWTIAMAPANNPKIAVVAMLVEGGYSSNAAPVTKEIISSYLGIGDKKGTKKIKYNKTDYTGKNVMQ